MLLFWEQAHNAPVRLTQSYNARHGDGFSWLTVFTTIQVVKNRCVGKLSVVEGRCVLPSALLVYFCLRF